MKSVIEQFVEDPANMRVFQQERAIFEVSELIEKVMREIGISRSELAQKLGLTKSWVTQLLDGEGNKTIRTVADVLAVMGHELHTHAAPITISNSRPGGAVTAIPRTAWGPQWKPRIVERPQLTVVGAA